MMWLLMLNKGSTEISHRGAGGAGFRSLLLTPTLMVVMGVDDVQAATAKLGLKPLHDCVVRPFRLGN